MRDELVWGIGGQLTKDEVCWPILKKLYDL